MSVNGDDAVLADITKQVNNLMTQSEAAQRAKESNWTEPQKFDYDLYKADNKDRERGAAAAAPAEDDEPNDDPTWAANATKYEWKDEYGEVGPAHEALERQLFSKDEHAEKGSEFKK